MGMKFHRSQFKIFQINARQLLGSSAVGMNDAEVVEVFFPQAKYIFLQRLSKVKQAISYSKALQTGIWNESVDLDQEYRKYVLPAMYDREHIECCFDLLLADDFSWKKFLDTNRYEYLHVWYEELVTDYETRMEEIYSYLGIKQKNSITPLLRQQSNKESLEWEKRFLEETPWTNDEEFRDAVARDDLESLWAFRSQQIVRVKINHRWKVMPATRYKSVRSIWFRIQRKLREIFSDTKTQ
jgi:LPS sulfotransferase NodH